MSAKVNRLTAHLGRALLCVVDSARPIEPAYVDINTLEKRFASPFRLPPLQPFDSLQPSSAHLTPTGEVSVYDIGDRGDQPPRLVCSFAPDDYAPSHAIWYDDQLWVLGTEQIVVYDAELHPVKVIRDPWLAGGHTIASDGDGHLLVSCSSSDAVLAVDASTGTVSHAWRVPEDWYGRNYALERTDSVVDHYIDNDRQLTHINCVWPWRGGLLMSMLIPGAIGWSDGNGAYRELVHGFVGCHGARVRSDMEEIYFVDSCSGMIVFLDLNGQVIRRVGTGSRWLQDAIQIHDDVFAAAVFDRNEVLLVNVVTREVTGRIQSAHGPRFLSFGRGSAAASRPAGERMVLPAALTARPERQDPDHASLRRQHAAMIRARDDLTTEYLRQLEQRDARIVEITEERNLAVTGRDTIIARISEDAAREIARRDVLLAEVADTGSREIAARDALLTDSYLQQAQAIAARDALVAALETRRSDEVAERDKLLAALEAHRSLEVAARDELLATLEKRRSDEVAVRDKEIATIEEHRAREVSSRDELLAEVRLEQVREVGLRDAMIADLMVASDRDLTGRDAVVAALRDENAQLLAANRAGTGQRRRWLPNVVQRCRGWIVGRG